MDNLISKTGHEMYILASDLFLKKDNRYYSRLKNGYCVVEKVVFRISYVQNI